MRRVNKAAIGVAFGLSVGFAMGLTGARAETQLFSPENLDAWADIRAVTANGEPSWVAGGFGKLRYGDEARVDLAQAAINWKPRFAATVTGYVLAQYVPDGPTPWGVTEAYIKWKPVPTSSLRYSVRLGQLFPPVSLEHDGPGWSVSRTLTPSAINAWIGEEVLVDALEGNMQTTLAGNTIGVTAAVFTGNDTSGTILSWRGWAQHDFTSVRDSRLPLPSGSNQGYYQIFGPTGQDPYTEPLAEADNHIGQYVRLDWRPPAAFAVNFEYYANNGDPNAIRHQQWGWDTRFYNLGLVASLPGEAELLSQVMVGRTRMGWNLGDGTYGIDAAFESAYVLVSRPLGEDAKLTGRVDYFAVKDWSMQAIDDNSDKGYSATIAWQKPMTSHLSVVVEGVQIYSQHPARATQLLGAKQDQTQLQVALKLHL